ncbi:MAG: formate dehydrogenase-N subunit alpha [Nitrospirae bacterium CG2_30_53_67]|nr:MAG: formate dehydrogenase-N subunit alpha [Nitrospirae bacterium CG2_30_53_67]
MTNHWIDIRNADVILIMGSNPAENHPISFKWITDAQDRGATVISVDPRFTRTSSKADIYAPIRSGSDIAFIAGMIRYILENDLYHRDYVRLYTNASFLVNEEFKMPGELDGVFSGYDPVSRKYDKSAWAFQTDERGVVRKDPALSDPHCVLELLKKHVSRYDPDTVSSITGTPRELLEKIYKVYASTGRPDRAATILYAMGWTQHTVGTQNIRAMAIVQLLLGNIGRAGGGVNALRGESNVQGSTDHGLLFDALPGYLKAPRASDTSLALYHEKYTLKTKEPMSANWWGNYPKYSVSLLKAAYGEAATPENDFGYAWLPKLDDTQDASWLTLFHEMAQGKFKGFFAWGQNPACSGSNAGKVRKALGKLDWMVNVNLFDNETGSFWRGPGVNPEEIKTEVFFLPCASSVEKEGSITNSGRWAQWRYAAVPPVGESMPDAEIVNQLYGRVKRLYEQEGGVFPDPVLKLAWDYGSGDTAGSPDKINTHRIAKEINGYFLKDKEIKGTLYKKGTLAPSFALLQEDGSTSSGNWLFCNSYTEEGNRMARRSVEDRSGIGLYPEWGWCWPVNRRIIYNRASVDEYGRPWDPARAVIEWKDEKWVGDVPDGAWPPLKKPDGALNPDSRNPFIMKPGGAAHIFGPDRNDGPFPEHYEPLECPIQENPMSSRHRINPTAKLFYVEDGKNAEDIFYSCDYRYPFVATTYRVSEHWQTGVMTRHQPWLLEMAPELFVEMSRELAADLGIRNGDRVKVTSARGEVKAVAMVTARFKPFKVMGNTVHQVGLPYHFGWQYPEDGSGGDSVNLLTPTIGDANTMIPETKAFMVNVEKL